MSEGKTGLRRHLTFANVAACVALVIALTMGSAYASNHLVGTHDIENRAVTTAKLDVGAVRGARIDTDAVSRRHIRDGAVGPDQLGEALMDRITELEDTVAAQETTISNLESNVGDLEGEVTSLQTLLDGVSRVSVDGNDTLRFEAMNVQVVNGESGTETSNSLGNLIIGYNEQPDPEFVDPASRTGSHYLVLGKHNEWTSFGGMVGGVANTASGHYGTVVGGMGNTAGSRQRRWSVVVGGIGNDASGDWGSILGGEEQTVVGFALCHPRCD